MPGSRKRCSSRRHCRTNCPKNGHRGLLARRAIRHTRRSKGMGNRGRSGKERFVVHKYYLYILHFVEDIYQYLRGMRLPFHVSRPCEIYIYIKKTCRAEHCSHSRCVGGSVLPRPVLSNVVTVSAGEKKGSRGFAILKSSDFGMSGKYRENRHTRRIWNDGCCLGSRSKIIVTC